MAKKYIKWCYESPVGKTFTELFFKRKIFSKIYGFFCDSKISKYKIPRFIKEFNIKTEDCSKQINEFSCFNDFFARELTQIARPLDANNNVLISPCDGRLSAYDNIDLNNIIQIKNITYKLSDLINNDPISDNYKSGTCLVFRLAPIDYHRFHFVDSGISSKSTCINGNYFSVNPIALNNVPKLFCENKREYSLFKSDNFGDILTIEVGATCVGSIIQTYTPNVKVKKGSNKGYFKFGGSTIILFFEKGTIFVDKDILKQSKLGFETKVLFGEQIATKNMQ